MEEAVEVFADLESADPTEHRDVRHALQGRRGAGGHGCVPREATRLVDPVRRHRRGLTRTAVWASHVWGITGGVAR